MNNQAHRIAIVSDSTCDLPLELAAQHGVLIAPQRVIWGDEEYLDRVQITSRQFYERLASDPTPPRTSQPTVSDFLDIFERARQAGAEEAVAILISDKLSGSVNAALNAAAESPIPVRVVNSKSVSMGLGWQVLAAVRARDAGATAEEIVAAADAVRAGMQVMFVVDTLEYLHRGGRIGGAAKLLGTALQLKPALCVDHETGRIEPGEKTRTMSRAVEKMVQHVFRQLAPDRPLHVAVQHCDALPQAEALAGRIRSDYNPHELLVGDASSAIGTHAGPGTYGICAYSEP